MAYTVAHSQAYGGSTLKTAGENFLKQVEDVEDTMKERPEYWEDDYRKEMGDDWKVIIKDKKLQDDVVKLMDAMSEKIFAKEEKSEDEKIEESIITRASQMVV